jgi:hypothetical protein
MLANFLSKSKPINFLILIGIFFCFYLRAIYTAFFVDSFHIDQLLKSGVFFVLFLSVFFFFNFVVSKNNLTVDSSYPFFLFSLFLSFFIFNLLEYKNLILLLLHLLFLRKIYSLKSMKHVLKKIFDAGFWLGISFLIDPLFALFFILMYAGIYLHQKITFYTLFSPIIGFLAPLSLYFTYCFWFDKVEVFLQLFNFDAVNISLIYLENKSIWFVGYILLLALVSFFIKSPKTLSVNNSFKKSWILLSLNLILTVFFVLIITEKNGSEVIYLLFPTSIIIANGLEIIKNKLVKNLILISILIGVIFNQFLL